MNPEDIVLRRMQLEDISEVRALDVLSFALPWTERSYRFELVENKTSRAWVAEAQAEDGSRKIAGMLVIWVILDEAHVATIATHPDYRRRRIGERLLAKGLLEAQKEGAVQAFLEVRRGNLAAQGMYQKFGFEITSVRPRYYRDNDEDALLMTLDPIDQQKLERLV